ncbi:MAG TPA: hypothetical protein VF631_05085 [Allosphingosinicella sp.]|jgi:hypothetical protein|uniref:hypothetical protein n=1 Tax=Allosphingosinicella sp. TaxID=2823234 RepID=UPI002F29FF62
MSIRYLTAAVALGLATASSAAVLVVRSSGPSARSFPPGKSLDDNGKIALKANDTLVVLDARGTRTLKGPGTFTPGGPAKAAGAMSSLGAVTGANRGRARVGAVRSVGLGSARPSIWHIDVSKTSNMCVASPAGLSMWRPDASKAAVMTLSGEQPGTSRQLKWAAGQRTQSWPTDLPISNGAGYRLSWEGSAVPTRIQFRTLATRPSALEDTASKLIQNGCTAQLDLLIETARLPEAGATPTG